MNTESRILRWSLILGIIIVLNLFFNYAITLVYESPQYEDFCPRVEKVERTENGVIVPEVPDNCWEDYDAARAPYEKNVFVILVALGALSVLIGAFLKKNEVISSGLSLAGVFSFIIASLRYWSVAENWARVLILAIALAILFWIAYKKFNDRIQSEGN